MISISTFLAWVTFQLSSIFILGIPFTIFIWSIKKKNKAVEKLLSIYWKISILFIISLILFFGKEDFSLFILNLSAILMTVSVWFWSDINRELNGYRISNFLITTTKIWRWALTFISLSFLIQSFQDITCIYSINSPNCNKWVEPSNNLYLIINKIFNFLFGANFSIPVAKFLGLFTLLIYMIGLLQWLVIKLPKSGRNSGFSNYGEY